MQHLASKNQNHQLMDEIDINDYKITGKFIKRKIMKFMNLHYTKSPSGGQ